MESYEVLRDAMDDAGAKAVAARLGLSTSLIYKWCQEPTEEVLDGRSGARNPLDRVHEICCTTENCGPVTWLCEKIGGFFVRNPVPVPPKEIDSTVIGNTRMMLKEFSDVLDEVSRALSDDMSIDEKEAKRIRREWEDLKAKAEGFVVACEQGVFAE